eukprot:TRINITY_DN55180_c0_g1_i1.p1 TRINITY_DN55180_c0_g1~~TRINITY_DN55180_c0_g1_i1.p1  ORF type:complete len:992 (+),score=283.37 TRINITY_DN55180_c0_g1_i1:134-3109(+)
MSGEKRNSDAAAGQAAGQFWWKDAGLNPLEPNNPLPTPQACVDRVARMLAEYPSLLAQRGPVGETILLWCVLNETSDSHLAARAAAVADYIIDEYTELLAVPYLMDESGQTIGLYDGETAVHIAVVQRNTRRIRSLLDSSSELAQKQLRSRAYGSFFSVGQCRGGEHMHGAELHAYYGELPLSFAAALGYEDSAEELLEGLDYQERMELLLARDSLGNTAAHIAVLYGRSGMLRWLIERQNDAKPEDRQHMFEMSKMLSTMDASSTCASIADGGADLELDDLQFRVALVRQKNIIGLTPLSLAALKGDLELFRSVVATLRRVLWTFGDITCYTLPLTQLDTDAETREGRYLSVLGLVVSEQRPQIALHELVIELFELKWESFGRACFTASVCIHIARLAFLTWAAVDFPETGGNPQLEAAMAFFGIHGILSLLWDHMLSWVHTKKRANIISTCAQSSTPPPGVNDKIFRMLKKRTEGHMIKGVAPDKLATAHLPLSIHAWLIFIGHLGTVAHVVSWLVDVHDAAQLLLAISAISMWTATVEYCSAHHRLGVLGIVIDKVVRKDMTVYVFFLVLVMVGFTEAFYVLEVQDPQDVNGQFMTLLLQMYRIALGEKPSWSRRNPDKFPVLVYVLYVLFSLYAFIVLLRLLICMFNRTEAEVQVRALGEMRLRWCQFVLRYERRLEFLCPGAMKHLHKDFYEFKAVEQAVPPTIHEDEWQSIQPLQLDTTLRVQPTHVLQHTPLSPPHIRRQSERVFHGCFPERPATVERLPTSLSDKAPLQTCQSERPAGDVPFVPGRNLSLRTRRASRDHVAGAHAAPRHTPGTDPLGALGLPEHIANGLSGLMTEVVKRALADSGGTGPSSRPSSRGSGVIPNKPEKTWDSGEMPRVASHMPSGYEYEAQHTVPVLQNTPGREEAATDNGPNPSPGYNDGGSRNPLVTRSSRSKNSPHNTAGTGGTVRTPRFDIDQVDSPTTETQPATLPPNVAFDPGLVKES